MARFGIGRWRYIQNDPDTGPILRHRSNVDLKDKWRIVLLRIVLQRIVLQNILQCPVEQGRYRTLEPVLSVEDLLSLARLIRPLLRQFDRNRATSVYVGITSSKRGSERVKRGRPANQYWGIDEWRARGKKTFTYADIHGNEVKVSIPAGFVYRSTNPQNVRAMERAMIAEVTAMIAEKNLSLRLHNEHSGGGGNLVQGDAFYNVYIIAQYASVDDANKAALKARKSLALCLVLPCVYATRF